MSATSLESGECAPDPHEPQEASSSGRCALKRKLAALGDDDAAEQPRASTSGFFDIYGDRVRWGGVCCVLCSAGGWRSG